MSVLSVIPGLLLALFLIWFLYRIANGTALFRYFWWGLGIKILAGLFIGWLYFNYYQAGDTINFWMDAVILRTYAFSNPLDYISFLWTSDLPLAVSDQLNYYTSTPRALFFTKYLSLLNLFCFDHYWILSISCSVIVFGGFYFLAEELSKMYPHAQTAAIIALLFFPSIVLWSGGVTKESLTMAVITLVIFIFLRDMRQEGRFLPWWQYLLLLLLLVISWNLKYYYTALLVPGLVSAWVINKTIGSVTKPPGQWISYLIVWIAVIALAGVLHVNLEIGYLPEVIKVNHDAFVAKSDPGDYIQFQELEANWSSIVQNFPLALWSGLFRPFLGDANTVFKVITAMENTFVLLLLVFQFKNILRGLKSRHRFLIISAIIYIVGLAVFLSVSTPNFGTLIRYKTGFWFLLVYLILADHPIFTFTKKRSGNG